MSTPEIVAGLRSFIGMLRGADMHPFDAGLAEARGKSTELVPVPVVIGIDEVDKIEDPQTAQAFFNQIKGLFGETRCLFLISISDDALAAYERRGLPLRDAFDSSLSTVITLSYLSRREARMLIGSRLVQITEPAADLLYLLSGGLPRELVRLIRRAVDIRRAYTGGSVSGTAVMEPRSTASAGDLSSATTVSPNGGASSGGDGNRVTEPKPVPVPLDLLAAALAAEQVTAQRRAVLIRGRVLEPCKGRDTVLAWAGDQSADAIAARAHGTPSAAAEYFSRLLADGAELIGACDGIVANPRSDLGGARWHADGCAVKETGAFLLWLATVGEVLASCATRADFEDAEQPDSVRSFERLARARQNFSIGPQYVHDVTRDIRAARGLQPS